MRLTTITTQDRQWIEQQALAAGFDLANVAAVADPTAATTAQRFSDWVEAGFAGDMHWLKRTGDQGQLFRSDLRHAIPWARSVLVCALNYNAAAAHSHHPLRRSTDPAPPEAGWIARYAWSRRTDDPARPSDYHDVLLARLRTIESALQQRFAAPEPTSASPPGQIGSSLQTRCYVDTGPIVERDYARRAGLGWIGKNTCLLNQQLGSWLLLGVVITSLELAPETTLQPAPDRCGTCTRCIDACPTDALIAPRQMDASLCIAYLTIEKKGPIDESLREPLGRQVFGCDICQDVCPWNRKAPAAAAPALPPREELVNPSLDWLASMDGPAFNRTFRGSPLERTGRKRLLRNVALAMGNSGQPRFIPRLRELAAEPDATVAEAARWALARLEAVATLETMSDGAGAGQ